MFGKPTAAKRLYFDVIPKTVDEYLSQLGKFEKDDAAGQLKNGVWHVHDGTPPQETLPLSFNVLLNLASACNTEDKDVLWGFIARYAPQASPAANPILDELVGFAIRYYTDFVKPNKRYRAADERERAALEALVAGLETLPEGVSAEDAQNQVYEIGKQFEFEPLRDWFRALYEILFGQEQGPRLGSFIALYGVGETVTLIRRVLSGEDLSAAKT